MTTYVINPITDELESAQPKQTVGDKFKLQTFVRDQFALGGGVIQGEKVEGKENFAKPRIVSQAVLDKVDLDELKRLRSQGFTTEQIANKFKVGIGSLENIISANKLPKPVVTKSKKRLKALNQVTNYYLPGKKWADVSGDKNNPFYRRIIIQADRITGTGQRGANTGTFEEFKKKDKAIRKTKADFEAAEKWIIENAKKYNDPVEMKKGFIKDLGSNNDFIKGTAKQIDAGTYFSKQFIEEILGGSERVRLTKSKKLINNILGSAIYNLNPKIRKQIVDALTKFAEKPMGTRYEAKQFFNKPLFKKFGIDRQINGPISRLILADLGQEIYDRVKQFRKPRNDTVLHLRYLSGTVSPKYKKEFLLAADAMRDAQKNLWADAKKKLNIADNINFEHKVPQSFIDAGYADKIEYAKVTPVPGKFNEAKYRSFDTPMRRLINAYEKTSDINEKKKIFSKMEDLKYDFSSKTAGYLDSVSITDKNGKIRFSSTEEVIKDPNQLRSLLEKNLRNVSNFAESKGFTLNSFAGLVDLSQAGIEIPASVRRSMDNVFKVAGKIARVGGKAAIVIDPLFAAVDYSKAMGKGVSKTEAAKYTGKKFLQDIANLPRVLEDVAYLATEKGTLKNFGEKKNRLFSYEPATFADESLKEYEEATSPELKKARQADIEYGQSMPTFVDDIEIPKSKEELDAEKELFFQERGTSVSDLDLPNQDDQVSISLSQGGRVGFENGSPPEIPGDDPNYSELQVMLDNPNEYNTFPKGTFGEELDKAVYGTNEERNLLQKFNSMFLDPRVYPYYAQKLTSGAANIPELAFRFPATLGYLYGQSNLALATGDLDRIRGKNLMKALEILDPKYTREIKNTKFGNMVGISDKSMDEQDKTEEQKFVGDIFELGAEAVGPATPLFLFKMFPKLPKQIKDLVGTASAAEKVNKEIEKNMAVDQTRRDLILTIGAGGAAGLLKFLGLDKFIKAPKATKAVTSAVKSGGTPQYFFDFVDLIKRKGKDVSDRQAVVERQKVIEYKDYTLTDTDGYITIRKTDEDMGRDEMMEYKPAEGVVVDEAAGKTAEVPAQYDEATARPDPNDPGNFDSDSGFESIDEVLDELSKDGKTYSKDDLLKMGIDPDALGNYPTGAGSIPEGRVGEANPFKPKKAGGGIIKLAGDNSGPPPKSGPTPHGLPYLAKNVTPIKERK